jgi:hypothetical protein
LESDLWKEIQDGGLAEHKTLRVTRELFSRDPQYYVFMNRALNKRAAVFF